MLDDSLFGGLFVNFEKTSQFLTSNPIENDPVAANTAIYSLFFKLKSEEKLYKRAVYTFLDLIGDVGGLYDGLLIITGFLMSSYNATFFEKALGEGLFKFQKTPPKQPKRFKKV